MSELEIEPRAPMELFEQTQLLRALLDVALWVSRVDQRDHPALYPGLVDEITAAVTSTKLFGANGRRRGGTIWNDSTAILYVALNHRADLDNWTVKLNQDDYYELPAGYLGPVCGVWASATGQARVTELT